MDADGMAARERVAVIGLVSSRSRHSNPERSLDELSGLVASAGGDVVYRVWQERDRPEAATYVGRGKLEEVALACDELDVAVVVVDAELSPSQQRQMERVAGRLVIDRTQLILDIFARRARTREGKLQVELAQLQYLLPRLVGAGLELSRLGGGIGTRGPGETKLETDRRRIRKRIAAIGAAIDEVRQRRSRLRERRHRVDVPTVALVGYTNAGKTTLFNLLASEAAVANDALFVTLDPLVRRVRLPDRRDVFVSDTVGFIDRLPHTLIAAFRATLEEVRDADLLLHVIDASAPDRARRVDAVLAVLDEVNASAVPRVDILNKVDRISADEADRLSHLHPESVLVSAKHGDGKDALLGIVTSRLGLDTRLVRITIDTRTENGRRTVARLYRHARVVNHLASDGQAEIEAEVPRRMMAALDRAGVMVRTLAEGGA